MFKIWRASLIACVVLSMGVVVAQQSKPLSNDDVVSMTKNHRRTRRNSIPLRMVSSPCRKRA